MKRSLFVVFCLATMVYAGAAYAYDTGADCIATACLGTNDSYEIIGQDATGCNRYYEICYRCNGDWKLYNCDSCKSGYSHSTQTFNISQYTSETVGQCAKTGPGTGTGIYCIATDYSGSNYPQIKYCSSIKAQKFGGEIVSTCEKCNIGYTLFSKEISVEGCSNTYTQKACIKDLNDCNSDNCKSDLVWSFPAEGADYMTKTNRSCRLGRCKEVLVYSCAYGYYGTVTATSQECHACPDGGTSTPGDNTEITKCFSTGGKDATGEYNFVPDCYYTGQ